eukprot:TRINITY_DN13805_c2_g2_i1.p1 TRINITY_DN13805_c2_g2~~TRINITY_DN13805_c2_g2_i1.p1  ORF type:complete len:913 (-),score=206.28 TRINITY_DN13805_c2_g2_i1:58-2796(-)
MAAHALRTAVPVDPRGNRPVTPILVPPRPPAQSPSGGRARPVSRAAVHASAVAFGDATTVVDVSPEVSRQAAENVAATSFTRPESASPSALTCSPSAALRGSNAGGGRVRRKLLCNLGAGLGKRNLLMVSPESEPVRPPYHLLVRYDLRPVVTLLHDKDNICLAALDVERLRRKGTGMGLDVLQCSESWIARDCICTPTGRLRLLTEHKGPGQVTLALGPLLSREYSEVCIMLRVVAVGRSGDYQDWRALGAPLVLRVDTVGELIQQDAPHLQRQRALPQSLAFADEVASRASIAEGMDADSEGAAVKEVRSVAPVAQPELAFRGVKVQQLSDFRIELRDDMERYVDVHCCGPRSTRRNPFHVCLRDPCPFRPMNFARYDDHRGVSFVQKYAMSFEDAASTSEMQADTYFVVARYIVPATKHTGGCQAQLMNPIRPLKATVFVSHSWSEPFCDFVETLETSLEKDNVVFVASFAMDHTVPCSIEGDMKDHEFVKLLGSMDKMVLIVDRAATVAQRLWCLFEVLEARKELMPCFVWPHRCIDVTELAEKLEHISIFQGEVSDESERDPIIEHCMTDEDSHEVQDKRLRSFLKSRIQIFASALQQISEFREFNPHVFRQLYVEEERRITLRELHNDNMRMVTKRNREAASLAIAFSEERKNLAAAQYDADMKSMQNQSHLEALHEHSRMALRQESRMQDLEDQLRLQLERSQFLGSELADERSVAEAQRRRAQAGEGLALQRAEESEAQQRRLSDFRLQLHEHHERNEENGRRCDDLERQLQRANLELSEERARLNEDAARLAARLGASEAKAEALAEEQARCEKRLHAEIRELERVKRNMDDEIGHTDQLPADDLRSQYSKASKVSAVFDNIKVTSAGVSGGVTQAASSATNAVTGVAKGLASGFMGVFGGKK